jgi:hypothetical protein
MKPVILMLLLGMAIALAAHLRDPLYYRLLGFCLYLAAVLVAWEFIAIQRQRRP